MQSIPAKKMAHRWDNLEIGEEYQMINLVTKYLGVVLDDNFSNQDFEIDIFTLHLFLNTRQKTNDIQILRKNINLREKKCKNFRC